jgi:seryl-tRNA synthetase
MTTEKLKELYGQYQKLQKQINESDDIIIILKSMNNTNVVLAQIIFDLSTDNSKLNNNIINLQKEQNQLFLTIKQMMGETISVFQNGDDGNEQGEQ